jgi:hypothetical protein
VTPHIIKRLKINKKNTSYIARNLFCYLLFASNLYTEFGLNIFQGYDKLKIWDCKLTLFSLCLCFVWEISISDENEAVPVHFKSAFLRSFIQKFPDWPPGARTANGTALCHYVQLYRYFASQSSDFCHHNNLCCFSKNVCCCKHIFRYLLSPETSGYTFVYL